MPDDVNFDLPIEFAENPEARCPCVLLLDTSGSMLKGGRIQALHTGLQTFKAQLLEDSLATRRVEVAIVTFDNTVKVVQDFMTPARFDIPDLKPHGLTAMGQG